VGWDKFGIVRRVNVFCPIAKCKRGANERDVMCEREGERGGRVRACVLDERGDTETRRRRRRRRRGVART
jgi:hypothetical protein